jgi:hypothetical protein
VIRRAKRPNARRRTPRRGRVVDLARLEWAATQPCCITGQMPGFGTSLLDQQHWHAVHTHHVRTNGSPKDDSRIIRLVDSLHLAGYPYSIHELGKWKFEQHWGISIEEEIAKLAARYEAAGKHFVDCS